MNIYVGNLSRVVSEDSLRKLFEAFGTVTSVRVIKDKFTGESKGYGFVDMSDDAQAQEAISKLDGSDFEGMPLKVNQARPREERPRFGGPRRDNRGGFGRGPRSGGGFGGGRGGNGGDRRFNDRGPRRPYGNGGGYGGGFGGGNDNFGTFEE